MTNLELEQQEEIRMLREALGTEKALREKDQRHPAGALAIVYGGLSCSCDMTPNTINGWSATIHSYAKEKGWWPEGQTRNFGEICALFHSEVTEAFEEYRNGHPFTEVYENPDKPGKLEGVPVELADVIIRILDFCGWAGIDMQDVMARKHAYNKTRPFRHGNKVC